MAQYNAIVVAVFQGTMRAITGLWVIGSYHSTNLLY